LSYFWKPRERLRLDIDARIGRSDTAGDRIKNKRDHSELGIRAGYQFKKDWWLSARYRYRTQENERFGLGSGSGNTVFVSLSYRLPEEIL